TRRRVTVKGIRLRTDVESEDSDDVEVEEQTPSGEYHWEVKIHPNPSVSSYGGYLKISESEAEIGFNDGTNYIKVDSTGVHSNPGLSPGPHSHDISDDTNLAASDPLNLNDDTMELKYDATDFQLDGSGNLQILDSGIDHNNLQNVGTYNHTQIDSHIASTSNPHSVTLDQAFDAGKEIDGADSEANALAVGDGSVKLKIWSDGSDGYISSNAGNLILNPSDDVKISNGKYIYIYNSDGTKYTYLSQGDTISNIYSTTQFRIYADNRTSERFIFMTQSGYPVIDLNGGSKSILRHYGGHLWLWAEGEVNVIKANSEPWAFTVGENEKLKIWTDDGSFIKTPFTGLYKATYNFKDDAVGDDPAGWTIVEPAGTTVEVVASVAGHNKVVKITKTVTDGVYICNNFGSARSTDGDTIELWVRVAETNKIFGIMTRDSTDTYQFAYIEFYSDGYIKWRYKSGLTWYRENLQTYNANQWYHIKFVHDFTNGNVDVYIDDTLYADKVKSNPSNPGNIQYLRINKGTGTDGGTGYIDAIGYSWDGNYNVGDNKTLEEAYLKHQNQLFYDSGKSVGQIGSSDDYPYAVYSQKFLYKESPTSFDFVDDIAEIEKEWVEIVEEEKWVDEYDENGEPTGRKKKIIVRKKIDKTPEFLKTNGLKDVRKHLDFYRCALRKAVGIIKNLDLRVKKLESIIKGG
ncbi:MAG: LamG-like jellyroll fold domain-containing protein, partial [Candidatus Helarchaeota archaeon]